MAKLTESQVAVMEPPEDHAVSRPDEAKRIREARILLEGCSPSLWTNDVLHDLTCWERTLQRKQRTTK